MDTRDRLTIMLRSIVTMAILGPVCALLLPAPVAALCVAAIHVGVSTASSLVTYRRAEPVRRG